MVVCAWSFVTSDPKVSPKIPGARTDTCKSTIEQEVLKRNDVARYHHHHHTREIKRSRIGESRLAHTSQDIFIRPSHDPSARPSNKASVDQENKYRRKQYMHRSKEGKSVECHSKSSNKPWSHSNIHETIASSCAGRARSPSFQHMSRHI